MIQEQQDRNDLALLAYVEAERATIPRLLDQYPGLYSEALVSGSRFESRGDRGIPAGSYSVVTFTYDYANAVDWTAAQAALDTQRSAIDELCETAVFPAMRSAGITGYLGVEYLYKDARDIGTLWDYSCWESSF
ncbi:hypothetical protein GCM10007394_05650 [Salinibacterium amurskyense]|nr:hypothetical protein D9C83_06260 [Salinibacterium amurskyense]GHD78299.1 hypothetical protein GCM10007394_05650 [Salinibacterium amurskyense]